MNYLFDNLGIGIHHIELQCINGQGQLTSRTVALGMTSTNQMVHVCQRCCNPLKLNRDFEKLQRDKVLALVDAQRPEKDDTRPPIIVPVRNTGSDYPRYVVPPNPNSLTDSEALANLQTYAGPTSGIDHRQKVNACLFDVLSGRTDVDHPLCQECADALLAAKQQCLEFQEEELDCLRSYMSYLDTKAAKIESKLKSHQAAQPTASDPSPSYQSFQSTSDPEPSQSLDSENWLSCLSLQDQQESNKKSDTVNVVSEVASEDDSDGNISEDIDEKSTSEFEPDGICETKSPTNVASDIAPSDSVDGQRKKRPANLSDLQATVNSMQATLNNLLEEGEELDQQLATDTAELERRTRQLDRAQTQYNEKKQNLLEAEEELLSLEARVRHAESHLQRLLRTNVLNIAFAIWYDGHIGVINGLHLGRLSNRPIGWDEINAAWGQCAMLLQCIARKLKHTFTEYRIIPMGSQSKLTGLSDQRQYPLYYSTSGMRLFSPGKFDYAMMKFLSCMKEVQEVVEEFSHSQLPYRLKEDGKIHDPQDGRTYSIKWSGNSEENWTKALKMMLINLKWIIAKLAATETQKIKPG
ncbi:unnamed protein product [Calicophoron daubneyi]|uniref:Atg6 BARA domain-containing protein n=1 Tax=Calicophoron daubneyi TaxID=300641 RepID=A0AAV2U171_CALDB